MKRKNFNASQIASILKEFENGKSFINSISILIAEKIIESMNGTVVFRGIKNNKGKYSFKEKLWKFQ